MSETTENKGKLVLASTSEARARLLRAVGLAFSQISPKVDEETVKESLEAEGAKPREIAETLAELKAIRSSTRVPGAFVIGSDQVLVHDGKIFSKPENRDQAKAHLDALRGSRHELITAAVVAKDGTPIWRFIDRATLVMRPFSDAFRDWYLDQIGDRAYRSVGCYEIEGLGATLFSKIEGDPFVIQGLPLLPLLQLLRDHKVIPA